IWEAIGLVPIDSFPAPNSDEYWPDNGAVALSHDGSLAAYASSGENQSRVLLWDCNTHERIDEWRLLGGYEELAPVGNDRFVLVREEIAKDRGNVQTMVYDLQPGNCSPLRLLRANETGDERRFLSQALTPDGRFYAWCGPRKPEHTRRVEVWDVGTGKPVFQRSIDCPPGINPGGTLSPD